MRAAIQRHWRVQEGPKGSAAAAAAAAVPVLPLLLPGNRPSGMFYFNQEFVGWSDSGTAGN
jgi:hypothetical protein